MEIQSTVVDDSKVEVGDARMFGGISHEVFVVEALQGIGTIIIK